MKRLPIVCAPLLVAAAIPGCLLNAVPEEMLTGGGPGDHSVVADGGQVDGASFDREPFVDRATRDQERSDAAAAADGRATDTAAATDRRDSDLLQPADSSSNIDRTGVDHRADDAAQALDSAVRDTSAVDAAIRDRPGTDRVVADHASPDGASQDAAQADTSVHDVAVRDSALRDLQTHDVTGRVVLFSDDFESGGVANWALSGPGAAWAGSTTMVASGLYSARARPSTTSDPGSVMERMVNTTGHTGIHIEYDRKLVAIDSADEFWVHWFDGTSELVLEQTGANAGDDNAFQHRTHALPASADNNAAFKLIFNCTAGAISEMCYVDNVVVWAEQ